MKKFLIGSAFLCAVMGLYACGEDDTPQVKPTVELDKKVLSLPVGATGQLSATVAPASAADVPVQWISADPAVATVDGEGLVTAVAVGETTVTASVLGGDNDVCKVTVTEKTVPVAGITLDLTELSLEAGQTRTLTATVTPSDATDPTVEWTTSDAAVATVENGEVTAVAAGNATITAAAGDFTATCAVTVTPAVIAVTGITLDLTELTLEVGQTQTLTATVTPSDATDPTVEWTTSNAAVATVENGEVTAVAAGDATITAAAGDFTATCTVTVNAPEPPKIGDYFYDDGTWSDGGLISIEPDGLNPVWADPKPAPKPGKTVVGIVFQTDPNRIADTDKAAGFTHGYVVAIKNAHGPNKATTAYSLDSGFDCLKGAKMSDTWYQNVNGYWETQKVVQTYGPNLEQCPAFDWTVTDFMAGTPTGTSGWFLPSTGQLWDMIANLCGHEVAVHMKSWSTQKLNAGWGYASEKVSYNVMARFNEKFAQIPASEREDLFLIDDYYKTTSIWASTPCTVGETACVISLGSEGVIELYEQYIDGDYIARPILAF